MEDRAIWIADVLASSEVDVKAWFDLSDLSEITMDSLKQAVEEAAMLITILDPSTFDSEWVQAENAWALAAGLPILAFYDADRYRWDEISQWRAEFPHVFKYQAIPYTKDFRNESRNRLLSAVHRVLWHSCRHRCRSCRKATYCAIPLSKRSHVSSALRSDYRTRRRVTS